MIATANPTSGENEAPSVFSGFMALMKCPATNPTGSSTMIAGRWNLVETIWHPTASIQ